jgi:hypothetical protein
MDTARINGFGRNIFLEERMQSPHNKCLVAGPFLATGDDIEDARGNSRSVASLSMSREAAASPSPPIRGARSAPIYRAHIRDRGMEMQ